MPAYSTIIRGALVFDGAGSPAQRTDIGLASDKISFVGNLNDETAPREIDASGLYAAPGFIDITNHSDTHWTLFSEPAQESLIRQGISAIMGGNCGSSLAPVARPEDISDFQKWADSSEVNINWQSFEEFIRELKNRKFTLNFGTLAGHGAIRRTSGMDVSRMASAEELEKIVYLLKSSLKGGAFGVSTSLGRSHSLSADDEEIRQVLVSVKEADGVATHHLEDEGAELVPAVSRIVSLSRESGAKSHLSHFKALGRASWPNQKTALEIIEQARTGGVELTLDFFPYTSTGSNLSFLLPEWVLNGSQAEVLGRLSDTETRKKISEYLKGLTLHYEKMIIASTIKDTGVAGKNVKEAAEDAGLTNEDTILELLTTNNLQVNIFNEVVSEENLAELARKDYSAISSDGFGLGLLRAKNNLPHPRSFGAFPRALKVLAKDKKILSWEEAIHKMTGLPAKILGLEKRGQIKKDFFADIVIFSPEEISDTADYKNPFSFSRGIRGLFVNGKEVLSDGNLTGQTPGQILLK